jgi:hypothetical protein
MPKLQSRHQRVQLDLFQARVKRPAWQSLPLEIQEKTLRLFARLLGQQGVKLRASNRKAADNE